MKTDYYFICNQSNLRFLLKLDKLIKEKNNNEEKVEWRENREQEDDEEGDKKYCAYKEWESERKTSIDVNTMSNIMVFCIYIYLYEGSLMLGFFFFREQK